jgi:antitoxin component YwqK of YwqJK toxin-antitoxin module
MMKAIFAIVLTIAISPRTFSQTSSTVFLDKYRFPTEVPAEAATYLKVQKQKGLYKVMEFYMTDTLKSEGAYSDKDLFTEEGKFVTYYKNGRIESEIFYQGHMRTGVAKYWYPNGQLKEIRTHNRLHIQVKEFYDSLGKQLVKDGTGTYMEEERDLCGTKQLTLVGPVRSGYKNGVFTGYLPDGRVYCKEEYEGDQLINGVSYQNGKEITYTSLTDSEFYERFMMHLKRHLRYPSRIRGTPGFEETVHIRLLIDKDYSVKRALIVKGVAKDVDSESIRVLKDTNFKYGPRKERGQVHEEPIFAIPLKFKVG